MVTTRMSDDRGDALATIAAAGDNDDNDDDDDDDKDDDDDDIDADTSAEKDNALTTRGSTKVMKCRAENRWQVGGCCWQTLEE